MEKLEKCRIQKLKQWRIQKLKYQETKKLWYICLPSLKQIDIVELAKLERELEGGL